MQRNKPGKFKFIYWFAYYNLDSPSVRYRAKFPLEFLKTNYGIGFFFVTPGYHPKNILLFLNAYFSALLFRHPNSLIVVQRINSNFIYANLLKFLVMVRKSDTRYDLDDADYLDHPPKTIYYFIKNCSTVSVGSLELQQNLSPFNKSILVNTSPTPDLDICKKAKNELLTVGWIGCFGGGHKESLIELFFPALKDLPFKIKLVLLGVVLTSEYGFMTDYFRSFENVALEMPQNIDWRDEHNIQQRISEFDVGIATLLNDELHRSKSAFKLKQYLNNGVPVLSSNIPENNFFIEEGRNGFLCTTTDDFRKRIIELHEMKNIDFMKLSATARTAKARFNLANYGDQLLSGLSNEE